MKRNWRCHYNIVLANILLALATGINFAVIDLAGSNVNLLLIAPILGILISALLYYFDIRFFVADYPYKKFHFNKRWSKFYIAGLIIYCVSILTLFIVMLSGTLVYKQMLQIKPEPTDIVETARQTLMNFMWASFAVTATLSLISFSLIKYARFKIDVELLQRNKGQKTEDSKVDSREVIINLGNNQMQQEKTTDSKQNEPDKPTAGLSSI